MGGMIAQEFALLYPERLRSLVLAATNCGEPFAILAPAKVWSLLFSKGANTPEENLAAMRPYTFAEGTPQHLIEEDYLVRLPKIASRTLVLHGQEDQLIPPANGRLLAQRIPGAELVEIEKASHWLATDQLDATLGAVRHFLDRSATKTA
jgi:pimeloyl-ACP methyl ester carboxylesterase